MEGLVKEWLCNNYTYNQYLWVGAGSVVSFDPQLYLFKTKDHLWGRVMLHAKVDAKINKDTCSQTLRKQNRRPFDMCLCLCVCVMPR